MVDLSKPPLGVDLRRRTPRAVKGAVRVDMIKR